MFVNEALDTGGAKVIDSSSPVLQEVLDVLFILTNRILAPVSPFHGVELVGGVHPSFPGWFCALAL